jgi:hypothetical protein
MVQRGNLPRRLLKLNGPNKPGTILTSSLLVLMDILRATKHPIVAIQQGCEKGTHLFFKYFFVLK